VKFRLSSTPGAAIANINGGSFAPSHINVKRKWLKNKIALVLHPPAIQLVCNPFSVTIV
jgi:hypothetical protein